MGKHAEQRTPDGSDQVIEAHKRDIDRTLLRRNLTLSVEQRLVQLTRLQQAAAALRQAGRRAGR